MNLRERTCRLRVAADAANQSSGANFKALAPVQAKTAVGKMVEYYLQMEPHLFDAAIEKQLQALQDEKERKEQQARDAKSASPGDVSNMVLYRRIDEAKKGEQRATVEDIMYVCVLEKFIKLGVPMIARLDSHTEYGSSSFKKLTEGFHSQEALEMVKTHVRHLMGEAVMQYDASVVRLPKLQAVQMYVTSIMFGYFLRRLDSRFQLERSAGLLGQVDPKEDAISRLERLFNQADSMELADSPDSPSASYRDTGSSGTSSSDSGSQSDASSQEPKKGALRDYVNKFGPETVQEMARVVSLEASQLIETQTVALFGDYRLLQEQMQKAVGSNFISMEDLMERVKKEVDAGSIESITISVGTQRRAILEAIAFGTFLRDVEDNFNSNYQLLTANPAKPDGPGGGGGGGSRVSIPGGL